MDLPWSCLFDTISVGALFVITYNILGNKL